MYGAGVLVNVCLDKCMPAARVVIPNERNESTALVWLRGRGTLEHAASDFTIANTCAVGQHFKMTSPAFIPGGVLQPGQRPTSPDLPQFPAPPVATAQRLSEVTNTLLDADDYTAVDRRMGKQPVARRSEEKKKQSAANSFEHIVREQTNFQKFQLVLLVPGR